ncbi:MAG TPA: hypothetical protein VE954_28760 [Oligoflexus sp.]|uniref:hypothetical protein n=1 Tax=Oligoflexus sp. TaxID=1971216 RepID=UPI002D4964D9|nr:hypothetical protein [Oligoflexus sp.]HYX37112.1 hypothetical protein [Oligoflexus sp.]
MRKVVLFFLAIVIAMAAFLIWNKLRTPKVPWLDAGLTKVLIESKECSSPRDCAQKLSDIDFLRSGKTNYCCVVKYKSDVILNEEWYKCRGHREPNGTLGRITAEYRCRGASISWTSGDSLNSGWGAGTEFSRDLEVKDCKDEERCTNGGKTPWFIPECNEDDWEFVKRTDCKVSGYWNRYLHCEGGRWVQRDVDGGCINEPGGSIK